MGDQLNFWEVDAAAPVVRTKKKRTLGGWVVVDHACRHCGGRVLTLDNGTTALARCAECGAMEEGGHAALCCCGAELGALGRVLECVRNPSPSKASPNQILVREKLIEAETQADPARRSNPVKVSGF